LFFQKWQSKLNRALSDKNMSFVLKGSVFTAATLAGVQAMRFITGIIIGRFYGPEVVGELALVTTLLSTVCIVANFGLKDAMLKFIPEYREKHNMATAWQVYKKGLWLLFLFSMAGSAVMVLFSPYLAQQVWDEPDMQFIFMLGALFVFPSLLNEFNNYSLRATMQIKKANINNLITVFVRMVFIVAVTFLFFFREAPIYAHYVILCGLAAVISSWQIIRHFRRQDLSGEIASTPSYGDIMSVSFPMLLTYASFLVYSNFDVFLLKIHDATTYDIGIYRNSVNISMLATTAMVAMNTTVQPKIAQLFHRGEMDEFRRISQKSAKLTFLLNIPVYLGLTLGARYILRIYGPEFEAGHLCLATLTIGQIVNAACGPFAQILNVTGNHKVVRNIALFGALLNVIFNLILIPRFGILGAAMSAAISMSIWNIMGSVYVRRKFGFNIAYLPFLNLNKL